MLADLSQFDPELATTLTHILQSEDVESDGMDFEQLGLPSEPVTNANRSRFVQQMMQQKLVTQRLAPLEVSRVVWLGYPRSIVDG